MRWSVMGLLLSAMVFLAGCAPVTQPGLEPMPGAVLTSETAGGYVLFTLTVDPPVDRAALRFPGTNLRTNSGDCTATGEALECLIHDLTGYYTLAVAGEIQTPQNALYGVACRASVCNAIYLSD